MGCGGGLPRITYFAELGPRKRDVTTTPRRYPLFTRSPSILICVWCVEAQAEWDAAADCLALRISPNWALENAMSRRHLEDSLFNTSIVEIDMCLMTWRPKLSEMRWRTASHYVFRRIRPSKTRYDDDTSKLPLFYTNIVDIDAYLVRDDVSRAQCSASLPRIAHSQIGASNRRHSTPRPPRFAR